MSLLDNHIVALRNTVTRLEDERNSIARVHFERPTISDAAAQLRVAFPTAYFSIQAKVDFHTSDNIVAEWQIYVSETEQSFFNAATLADAVAAALKAIEPPPANPVASVEEALAAPMPF